MKVTVNNLPDECLLYIFDRLLVFSLMFVGIVCSRWNIIRTKSVRARTQLVLLVGQCTLRQLDRTIFTIPRYYQLKKDDHTYMFRYTDCINQHMFNRNSFNSLKINYLDLKLAAYLSFLFVGVTDFAVGIRSPTTSDLDGFALMLYNWRWHVISLKIHDFQSDPEGDLGSRHIRGTSEDKVYGGLLPVINSMRALKKLELSVSFAFAPKSSQWQIDLPILSQLDLFNFNSRDPLEVITSSLTRYNHRHLKIGLHYPASEFYNLFPMSAQFTQLNLFYEFSYSYILNHFCNLFSNLTTLCITVEPKLDITDRLSMYRSLSRLVHLFHLILRIDGHFLANLGMDEYRLSSVRMLTLDISPSAIESHNILADRHSIVGSCFPQVQVIQLYRDAVLCNECIKETVSPKHYEDYCLPRLIGPLFQCNKLAMVKTNKPNREWKRDAFDYQRKY